MSYQKCFTCAEPALMERVESWDPRSPDDDKDVDYSFWCLDHAPEGAKPIGCEMCGEDATHLYCDGRYKPTQPVCDECNDPSGEPKGDSHPMGGMGYGISYDQTENRRLK